MSQNEMIEAERQKRATSKIYKAESIQVNNEAISHIVSNGLAEIIHADNTEKIELSDVEMVKAVSKQYIKACADASTFPSMAGLARAMGCNRASLYHWMNNKRDTDTGKWIQTCHDLFSDMLSEASLHNNVNGIVAIFLQKAQYGLRDSVSLEVSQQPYYSDDEHHSADFYRKKYENLI